MLDRLRQNWQRRVPQGDAGSMLPLILVFVLIVVLMIMGMMTSTAAFVAQRDLQGVCDSAATWAAAEAAPDQVYENSAASEKFLPLSPEAVAAAVAEHQARFYANDRELRLTTVTNGDVLTVKCHTTVKVPFGRAFGKGDGIGRDTESVVRSPVAKPSSAAGVADSGPAR